MREFLDAILDFIEAASLSNGEFDTVTVSEEEYTLEVYQELRTILESRDTVSNDVARLNAYFVAKGLDLGEDSPIPVPSTNILIGKDLG